jgi:polyisoprenoid-binding protein YceI
VSFKVKHLVVSTVTGHFRTFDATIETAQPDFSDAVVRFEAEVDSIDTKNAQRDGHLKSADFFDAATHPTLSFVSKKVARVSVRGVTKPVSLDVVYNGTVAGFGGNRVAGFEIRTKLNRFDFGLQWNAVTEAGGVVVSNEVKIEILAEFNAVQEQSKAA